MLGYVIDSSNRNIDKYYKNILNFTVLLKADINDIVIVKNHVRLYSGYPIYDACKYGHIEVLEWLKKSGQIYENDKNNIISKACEYGHVKILNWLKNSGYKIKSLPYYIDCASYGGHIHILKWLHNYDIDNIKKYYSANTFNCISKNNRYLVLKWFKTNNYKFKYYKSAIHLLKNIKMLKIYIDTIHIKKIIKWSDKKMIKMIKTIKFKTKNSYIKSYNKN